MTRPQSELITHLERNLGPISAGWSGDLAGEAPFQVARFEMAPEPDAITLTTVGFSNYILTSDRDRAIRTEFVFACRDKFADWNGAAILQQIGSEALASGRPFLRGDVLGPRGALFPEGTLTALYFTLPVYFARGFQSCDIGLGEPVALVWAVPVTDGEAGFIKEKGWEPFEDILEAKNPDLLDLSRGSIVP